MKEAKVRLLPKVRNLIRKAIIKKFEELHPQTKSADFKSYQKYGYGNYDPSKANLKGAILEQYLAVMGKKKGTFEGLAQNVNGAHLYNWQSTGSQTVAVGVFYLTAYLLYIAPTKQYPLFRSDFSGNFSKILAPMLEAWVASEELNPEQKEEQLNLISEFAENSDVPSYYKCYHYDMKTRSVVAFLAHIYHQKSKIEIPDSLGRHTFIGKVYPDYPVVTAMELRNVDKVNGRVLYIILTDAHIPFPTRQISMGVYINVDKNMNPAGGDIIFEKVENELADLKEIHPAIELYLKEKEYIMRETEVFDWNSFLRAVDQRHPDWNMKQGSLREFEGCYACYTKGEDGRIFVAYLQANEKGEVHFKWNLREQFQGQLDMPSVDFARVKMKMSSTDAVFYMIVELPRQQELVETELFRGVFMKARRDMLSGKCYWERLPKTFSFAESKPHYCKEVEIAELIERQPKLSEEYASPKVKTAKLAASLDSRPDNIELHLFNSACYCALRGEEQAALKALAQAKAFGFKDKVRFGEESDKSFRPFKEKAIEVWNNEN